MISNQAQFQAQNQQFHPSQMPPQQQQQQHAQFTTNQISPQTQMTPGQSAASGVPNAQQQTQNQINPVNKFAFFLFLN